MNYKAETHLSTVPSQDGEHGSVPNSPSFLKTITAVLCSAVLLLAVKSSTVELSDKLTVALSQRSMVMSTVGEFTLTYTKHTSCSVHALYSWGNTVALNVN